jgi:starch-binding outer membrane protein, SusD/RagB family
MKRYIKIATLSLLIVFSTISCEDYLNIPPEADISEEQIFGNYAGFQGFQDKLLNNLVDYNNHGARVTHSIGGEALSPSGQSVFNGNLGNYFYLLTNRGIYAPAESNLFAAGLYSSMWENIRIANLCIEKLESGILKDATDEQRKWLKGQALFFRAYYYYEYARSFGTVPYVDKVFTAEEQDMKRHWTYEKNGKTYKDVQAVFERIVDDLDEAATLLPAVWPLPNINWGRPTKLAALGFKAKALQYSASPLFNEQATGILEYNKELLDRCAFTCKEVIDLAVSLVGTQPAGMPAVGADALSPWASLRTVFATDDGTAPGTPEVLFHRKVNRFGAPMVSQSSQRGHSHRQLTNERAAQGSQNYLDLFEMKDGSRYQVAYDLDPARRWVDRDDRFKFTFYTHGDKVHTFTLNFSTTQTNSDGAINSNAIRKYLCDDVTKSNPKLSTRSTPLLRLADIYLTYAEAVFESTGSYNTIPTGLSMTAADAVDKVRLRAGQPNVASTLPFYEGNHRPNTEELASDPAFRLLYRNERAVELAYESHYWFDLRRWKRSHLKDGENLQALRFNVVGSGISGFKPIVESSITRVDVTSYVFKDQHYWMPFDPSLTRFTKDWEQNPGW